MKIKKQRKEVCLLNIKTAILAILIFGGGTYIGVNFLPTWKGYGLIISILTVGVPLLFNFKGNNRIEGKYKAIHDFLKD